MGQNLSEPVTDKATAWAENGKFAYASTGMQGWRITMEDAHTNLLSLPGDPNASFFAVFDGHGGSTASKYAGEFMHLKLVAQPKYQNGAIAQAFNDAYVAIDDDMRAHMSPIDTSGTTAVSVLIRNNKLYCANAGDSRAVFSKKGVSQSLSHDHKPTNELEMKRIVAAGGMVDAGRVNGNLALSRALGDFEFKQNPNITAEHQVVTCCPDVIEAELDRDCEFIVVACDGIWDVLNNQEVVDFVRAGIKDKMQLREISEAIVDRCLAKDMLRSSVGGDNMTVIIVANLDGRSYEEWIDDILMTV